MKTGAEPVFVSGGRERLTMDPSLDRATVVVTIDTYRFVSREDGSGLETVMRAPVADVSYEEYRELVEGERLERRRRFMEAE